MRRQCNLNFGWQYSPEESGDRWEDISLPHTNREIPSGYFDDGICSFVSRYRRTLYLDKQEGKVYRLCFEGISSYAKLYVNGRYVCEHKCAYTDFYADITDFAKNGENEVLVIVDSAERADIPPFGGVVDYLCYGGIYRDAWLIVTDCVYIQNVYCHSVSPVQERDLTVEVALAGGDAEVKVILLDGDREIAIAGSQTQDGRARTKFLRLPVELWSVSSPKRYTVRVYAGEDEYTLFYGFREAKFTAEGFYLNGERLFLMGLNRHQSFPYVGYAMPRNAQIEDADILKYTLGVNIVRTSHYPQSRHFLDRCDEIGLLVFEEIPGWNHIGDDAWKEQTLKNLYDMIIRDRNRPSVVLWGVRINESEDDHDFYTRTNALAHSIDSRQTAGVRWKPHSEFLEDVFAINDFVPLYEEPPLRDPHLETGLDCDVPYLVTEYMGHMFPTKITDNEERLARHALRHAEVQNLARSNRKISGAIGWCAFDYHTHRHFGTNDKICYHGVMDIYRNPKYAAFVYASQRSVKEGLVFEPATIWAFGERDIGGVVPLYIYTNVEEVVLEIAGRESMTYYPAKEKFPRLPHPPVIIDKMPETWGCTWQDGTLIGKIGGKEVVRREYSSNPLPDRLELTCATKKAAKGDSVRFTVRALDHKGNVMKYFDEIVSIRVNGGRLVGRSEIALQGGMYTFWVIADGNGAVSATAESARLKAGRAEIGLSEYESHYSL